MPVVVSVVALSRRDKLDRLASANKIKWPEEADDPPLSRRIVANENYIKQQLGCPAYIPKKARGRRGVQYWPAKCWSRQLVWVNFISDEVFVNSRSVRFDPIYTGR